MSNRFVFDTNSLVSAALINSSVSRKALYKAVTTGRIAISDKTHSEFVEVLFRRKFDKYFLNDNECWKAIDEIEKSSIWFHPAETITDCHDPKENKFLELAIWAIASCIITGDNDLLILNPYRNISIINASYFLEHFVV